MELAEKIKTRRKQKGISQKELADKIGVAQATINKIENGNTKNTSVDVALKIAKALNENVYDLFGDESFTTKPEDQNKLEKEIEELKTKLSEKEHLIKALQNEKKLFGSYLASELVSSFDLQLCFNLSMYEVSKTESEKNEYIGVIQKTNKHFWDLIRDFKDYGFISDSDIEKAIEIQKRETNSIFLRNEENAFNELFINQ